MKAKKVMKSLLAAALAVTMAVTPSSFVKAEEPQGTYTVEKNDNLCKISKKLFGSEKFWREIYNANSALVKDNYLIYAGQILTIPSINSNAPTATTPAVPATPAATTPAAPATPAATTPAAPATPAATTPAAPATPAPAATEGQQYTLDYNAIAAWADGGFIGVDASGSPVVMALNASADYAVLIFCDNSDMTAASFVGPLTETDTLATITDETNGLALTFGVTQLSETSIALDMGEIGTATITAAAKEDLLNVLKIAIENYKHIA